MTLEALFAKEYEGLKAQVRELEKENRLLEMQNRNQMRIIEEVKDLIQELKPEIVNNSLVLNSKYYHEEEKIKAMRLFAKMGFMKIEGSKTNQE